MKRSLKVDVELLVDFLKQYQESESIFEDDCVLDLGDDDSLVASGASSLISSSELDVYEMMDSSIIQ